MVRDKGRGLVGSEVGTGQGWVVLEGLPVSDAIAREITLNTPAINNEHSRI
jgi:hypothetical protein